MNKQTSLLLISVLALIVCHYHVSATKYSVCESDKSASTVTNVVVSQCETTQDACPFYRGFNKTIELDFVPKHKFDQVKVKVIGKLNALPVPFFVKPDDACGNYGFDCPLEEGKPYKFKLTLPILRTYPKINVDVFLRLIDEKGDIIACVELPAKIQEPEKN